MVRSANHEMTYNSIIIRSCAPPPKLTIIFMITHIHDRVVVHACAVFETGDEVVSVSG